MTDNFIDENTTFKLETGKGYQIAVKYNTDTEEFDLHLEFPDKRFYLVSVSCPGDLAESFEEAKSIAVTWLQMMRRVAAQEIRQMEESARQYAQQLDTIEHLEEQMEVWADCSFRLSTGDENG